MPSYPETRLDRAVQRALDAHNRAALDACQDCFCGSGYRDPGNGEPVSRSNPRVPCHCPAGQAAAARIASGGAA